MAQGESYEEFVDKFKPKKTTDDCYTPTIVYNAIAGWVSSEFRVDPSCFIRPFYPGGDYENAEYPEGCIVVDNPPFSILSKICKFYMDRGIRFFLFAPTLTLFNLRTAGDMSFLVVGEGITYENGAEVNTSFTTNLEPGGFRTVPELRQLVKMVNFENTHQFKTELPKYAYPYEVISSAMAHKLARYGIEIRVPSSEYTFIHKMDAQIPHKKTIFGGGFLLSERAAAERAAAERAAAERAAAKVWELSDREREIVRSLGK